MRVTVQFTAAARQQILALVAARSPTEADALVTATLFVEEVIRLLRAHAAPPPGAIVRPRAGGGWWLFAGGMWLAYEQDDRPSRLWPFRGSRRAFTVVAAAAQLSAA